MIVRVRSVPPEDRTQHCTTDVLRRTALITSLTIYIYISQSRTPVHVSSVACSGDRDVGERERERERGQGGYPALLTGLERPVTGGDFRQVQVGGLFRADSTLPPPPPPPSPSYGGGGGGGALYLSRPPVSVRRCTPLTVQHSPGFQPSVGLGAFIPPHSDNENTINTTRYLHLQPVTNSFILLF